MQEEPEITKKLEEAKTIIGDVDINDIPNTDEGRQILENIATNLFSKLKPFDVKKVTIRDIEGVCYNAFSQLHFGRSIESTMVIDVTMSNDITFYFGYGNTDGNDQSAMGIKLPGSHMAFLCKHRLKNPYSYSYKINPDTAKENRALWVKIAKKFKMKLVDFESFIQLAAIVLGMAFGFKNDWWISEEWVSQFSAPVKTKVVTYEWK